MTGTNLKTTGGGTATQTSPPFDSDWMEATFSALSTEGREHFLPPAMMPSEARRASLTARVWTLHERLSARGLDRAFTDALTALLASKPSQTGGESSLAIRGAAYRMALEDLPEWAVVEACRRAIRSPGKWAPNPGELRELAIRVIELERAEAHRIAKILSAKPLRIVTPESRERVRAMMAGLVHELSSKSTGAAA